jgi:hypothetical protein
MRKGMLFLCLFFIAYKANSQQFIERVYLKDSSFYEGYIIEQVPTQYLKIDRIKEKDTVTVLLTEVWKITKQYTKTTLGKTFTLDKNVKENKYVKNAYLELLGNAGLYSFNFDMRTEKGIRDKWGFRIGFGVLKFSAKDSANIENIKLSAVGIPFGLNYLIGKKENFLELGIGATYFNIKYKGQELTSTQLENYEIKLFGENLSTMIGTFNIGFKHVPFKNGFMYKIALTPLLISNQVIPFLGFGFGYKF